MNRESSLGKCETNVYTLSNLLPKCFRTNRASHDGGSRLPTYTPPPHVDASTLTSSIKPGQEIHYGNCHCGSTAFAVKCGRLEEQDCNECDCSICFGNGVLWIYPHPTSFHIPDSARKTLKAYTFGPKENQHWFCTVCGVNVYEQRAAADYVGVNARLVDGVNMDKMKGLRKGDASKRGEPYKCPQVV